MPIVAAAVCPHPPIIVPELASGAAHELDDLRIACATAVDSLRAADVLLIVGSGPSARYGADAAGSFGPYGAPQVRVDLGGAPVAAALPLSLLVGAWLTSAVALPREAIAVPADASPAECRALGEELAADERRLGLLVMGDGSARRSEHSPVHLHPRAELFDNTTATALATADRDVLAALDPELAGVLQAAGRAPWQVLAAATAGRRWQGRLLYDAAPYGVGYFVATWAQRDDVAASSG
ncbi:hypothetical protein FB561_6412 [Kribbella amoyensis]|uniref:Catalytic LigB subunit of aromatic ring-opening dioxygenase n=1 Tax=Kribbella amoyensis TaxID=996641 RepID=A0A561B876_9ACTN|nr:class III extradiol dioxygenase subunit B-like domain-containing protein [Kribbella amoyensis]TWD74977.1 hypothetical protein FB561_6412 [Kribbella amoyensis]